MKPVDAPIDEHMNICEKGKGEALKRLDVKL